MYGNVYWKMCRGVRKVGAKMYCTKKLFGYAAMSDSFCVSVGGVFGVGRFMMAAASALADFKDFVIVVSQAIVVESQWVHLRLKWQK